MYEGVVPTQTHGLIEVGQCGSELLLLEREQAAIEIGLHELRVAFQGGIEVGEGGDAVAGLAEHVAAIEVAPGEVGPESDAVAEIAERKREFARFLEADAALGQRPVVAGLQDERL